jgi:serine/threonine-protein kinase
LDAEQGKQMLGKYQIVAEIGRGGFATVYRALDSTLDREVALKILHPQLLVDAGFVERFQREARALAQLRHPHIVTVHEVGQAEGRLYIAMELAKGPNLAQAIEQHGSFPWAETLELLEPIAEALDYAHGKGTVHRDLKPSNILLDEERGPLLSDFGFARLMSGSSISLSVSGGILGTPSYIAPEVWELDAAQPAVDIYALGCIVCEMLTGEILFTAKTPMQVMRAHDRGPQFPQSWPEGVPPGIEEVLGKALARDGAERYPSARALRYALADVEKAAQTERQTAEQAAVAAQWRAETETAMASGEWSAARMAVGRWLAVAPQDAKAQAARQEIERQLAAAEAGALQEGAQEERPDAEPAVPEVQLEPERPVTPPGGRGRGMQVGPLQWGGMALLVLLLLVVAKAPSWFGSQTGQEGPTATPQLEGTLVAEATLTHQAQALLTRTAAAKATNAAHSQATATAAARQTETAQATATASAEEAARVAATGTAQAALTATAEHAATQTAAAKSRYPTGRILFTSGDAEGLWLWVIDLQTGAAQRLADLGNYSMDMVSRSNAPQYAWLQNGQRIAYVYGPVDSDDALYVINADGSGRAGLGGANGVGALAASPDGKQLLHVAGECLRTERRQYSGFTFGPTFFPGYAPPQQDEGEVCVHWVHRIYSVDPVSGQRRLLRENLCGEQYRGISWSPDGSRLAIISNGDVQGNHRLWVMDADGGNQRLLTPGEGDHQSPSWSPDGQLIAFSSNRDGNYEIYTIRPDGSDLKRLTESVHSDFAPYWAPESGWLAFCSDRDGTWGIWVMDRQGGQQRRLVAQNSMWPVWGK